MIKQNEMHVPRRLILGAAAEVAAIFILSKACFLTLSPKPNWLFGQRLAAGRTGISRKNAGLRPAFLLIAAERCHPAKWMDA